MSRIRSHLTYANVMATLAVFIALGGGTAVALTGSNTVQSDDLGPGSQVKAPDVAANAVNGSDVVDNSLTGSDVNEAGLDATRLATRVAQGGCSAAVAGTGVMVKVGSVCIDKYEASVWSSPTGGTQLTTNAQINAACPDNGQPTGGANCQSFYARSVAGVEPARFITYFQAQQALANSGKRLPTNAEWQQAVSGTPDTGGADSGPPSCNTDSTGAVDTTGSRANCVSRFGAFDMVGNLWEWVGDWLPLATACGSWSFSDDAQCIRGAGTTGEPGALLRGGFFFSDTNAGPFAVGAGNQPSLSTGGIGFRGAR